MFAVEVEKVFVGFTIFDVEFMQTCLSIPEILITGMLQKLEKVFVGCIPKL